MFKVFDKAERSRLHEFVKRKIVIHLMQDMVIKSTKRPPQNSCWSHTFFLISGIVYHTFPPLLRFLSFFEIPFTHRPINLWSTPTPYIQVSCQLGPFLWGNLVTLTTGSSIIQYPCSVGLAWWCAIPPSVRAFYQNLILHWCSQQT